ncbi:hypothetical protein [Caballeronia sp. GAWG1-5s-s]|uniref:hypothetical protein n=1 Tax=Caballeronia sp. GAWG1-5s-s TaxID=2921743 RepID=UPI00202852E6|nr:hypothetical protein [Caballeronia sp. GAWG1-5s-s]
MKATDVLFLVDSLKRRTDESPDWADALLAKEVFQVAGLAKDWLDYQPELRCGLALVHSYLVLGMPRAALARLEATMLRLATAR